MCSNIASVAVILAVSSLACSVSCAVLLILYQLTRTRFYTVAGVVCSWPIHDRALKHRGGGGIGRLTFSHDSCQFAMKKLKGPLQSQNQLYETRPFVHYFFSWFGFIIYN